MKLGNHPPNNLCGKVLNPAKQFVLIDKRGLTYVCASLSFEREAFIFIQRSE